MGDLFHLNEKYSGSIFTMEVKAERNIFGYWDITARVSQSRKEANNDWDSKDAEASVSSIDLEDGVQHALLSIMAYLHSVDYDLFSEKASKEIAGVSADD